MTEAERLRQGQSGSYDGRADWSQDGWVWNVLRLDRLAVASEEWSKEPIAVDSLDRLAVASEGERGRIFLFHITSM